MHYSISLEGSVTPFHPHHFTPSDVPSTAKHVCALLNLELDDLRKAALLSLMVRLAGKRKFDPIASYILKNRHVFVTTRS